jgi:hypothetical protein
MVLVKVTAFGLKKGTELIHVQKDAIGIFTLHSTGAFELEYDREDTVDICPLDSTREFGFWIGI